MKEYSQMLLESAKQVYKIIQNPKATEENKMLIASANTLAQTTKEAIHLELLEYRKQNTYNNTTYVLNKTNNETINMER